MIHFLFKINANIKTNRALKTSLTIFVSYNSSLPSEIVVYNTP